ncbi:MAG: nitroreductase family protein [Anaerolineae bacterium]
MPKLEIPNLFARRSIRQFTTEPVDDEQIETLLQAAMAAPSAGNRKPWHFLVVTDAEIRARLAEDHPYAKMVSQAPVCIVPCGQPEASYPGREAFWIQDCAAATENILLAATALGLGSVWCGVHPIPERESSARRILGIPEDVVPFAYIAIGHPAEIKEPRTQFDAARVHRERW